MTVAVLQLIGALCFVAARGHQHMGAAILSERPEHMMAMARAHYERFRCERQFHDDAGPPPWEELSPVAMAGWLMCMDDAVAALERRGSGLR